MGEADAQSLHHDVLQQAAEWFAYLRDENISGEDKQRWQSWLEAAPEHRRAWERVEKVTGKINGISDKTDQHAARQALSRLHERQYTKAFKSLAIIFCACLAGWFGWQPLSTKSWHFSQPDHHTAIGETRQITLVDGTEVWLNTASSVDIDYNLRLRRIVLRDGEILIESVPDNASNKRPLVVDTSHGRLTALGTRFNVHQHADKTAVTVFEGAVNIALADGADSMDIQAGSEGEFDDRRILKTAAADPARQTWARGILLADNRPLCDFITELDRYHDGKLVCAPAVAHLKLVGAYPLKDTDRILAAVQSSLPVTVWQVRPGIRRIDRR